MIPLKTLATATLLTLGSLSASAETLWTVGGFDMPESVLYDPVQDHLVVSVMEGTPMDADGNGHLAILSKDGSVLDANWTTGMDAPKGMALMDGKLFVADLTRLHIVDAGSGELLTSLSADGAVFLNDVTTNGEDVFVSDLMTNSIWRYSNGNLDKWLVSEDLAHPNGLLWDAGRLLVGSWGKGLNNDFSTEEPGNLLAIDPEKKTVSVVAARVGNIDGIVRYKGNLVLNDWITGAVYKIEDDGSTSKIGNYAPGLADIGADEDALYLPHMLDGRIEAVKVSR